MLRRCAVDAVRVASGLVLMMFRLPCSSSSKFPLGSATNRVVELPTMSSGPCAACDHVGA